MQTYDSEVVEDGEHEVRGKLQKVARQLTGVHLVVA
jgi:hypothetical protein